MIPLKVVIYEKRNGYTDVWHVAPPQIGREFTVTQCEWTEPATGPERHIYQWSSIERRTEE